MIVKRNWYTIVRPGVILGIVLLLTVGLLPLTSGLATASASELPGAPEDGTIASQAHITKTTEESTVGIVSLPADPSADWWAAVQEDIRQSEYHVTWQEQTYLSSLPAAYQAPNRAHNLRTYFTPTGIRAIPRTATTSTWKWNLSLTAYGYVGQLQPIALPQLVASGNRIEYRRADLTEWYVNTERGLEQGFTLAAAPKSQIPNLGSRLALELALTGDLTPHLADDNQAIEFSTSGGVRVLRYSDLHAYDATGRTLPAQMDLMPLSNISPHHIPHSASHAPTHYLLRIMLDDTGAVYPITIDPLATSPQWTAQESGNFGCSVSTAGDVNGDGYTDIIVGADYYDNGQTDEGRAFVYYGSATGLSTTPNWTAESDQANANFGFSVSMAGDVNGDGYADIVVGAPYYDIAGTTTITDAGRIFVYQGSVSGLSTTPNWTVESDCAGARLGFSVGTAGDVNGDGYADIIVGADLYRHDYAHEGRVTVYYGSPSGLSAAADWTVDGNQQGAWLGVSVGTAGDVNGDGYADIIVGASGYDNGETDEGQAYLYQGSASGLSTTPNWTAESNQAGARFGRALSTAGDINGDGYTDVIVGAKLYDITGTTVLTDAGRVYAYQGSASGLNTTASWTADGDQADANLGATVSTVGDVDGDGYADIIVGAPYYDGGQYREGRAYVYHGSASGLSSQADWTAESDQAWAEFGSSVSTAGDVDGDGYADAVVGVPGAVRAYVYHGSPSGLSTAAGWTTGSDQANANFGHSVSRAGDVNGDGYADVIVGAPNYDNGETDEGRAFVYYGSATGLSTTPNWTAEGNQANANFGYSVNTAGDVNGDGYTDVIVGARYYDNGQTDEGRAFLYYGSATGLSATVGWMAESNQADANFGRSVGTAGDVNGDGYADVIVGAPYYDNGQTDEGRAFVYYGSATGLSTTPNWTAESNQANANFGCSVNTAGDVNGDGYTDVIVGARYYDNGQTDEGRAFLYYGSATGLSATVGWTAESNQADANFGRSVDTAGDVNGDGYADVIVGAPYYDNGETDEGQAFVYYGSATGPGFRANWTAGSDQASAYFGYSVSTAGDVNGDGYADVIVGAGGYNGGLGSEQGRAYVYHGSPSGLSDVPNWTAESDQAGAGFGYSVGTAGDVDGDGCADVIVGALHYDITGTPTLADAGRAFVYYSNDGDGLAFTPLQLRTDGSTPIAPLGMSDSVTAVSLGLTGRMPLGRESVKLQWQVAPLGTPFTATTTIGGTSANWTDVLITGVPIIQNVTGLAPGTSYHWRARLLYRPGNRLGQSASRWLTIPWNGWTEQDFRTPQMVSFSSATYAVNESSSTATITVNLSTQSGYTVTVNYATSDGTATAGNDYTAASGTLTFSPGQTSRTFNVAITDDTMDENNETVNLTLSNPANATIGGTNPATLTIMDNDGPPTVSFSSATYTVNEGAGTATIAVNLSVAPNYAVTVNYATSDGTATAGQDYTAANGTLTFSPGQTSRTFNVAITDDTMDENNETVNLTLSNAVNATIGGTNPAILTITDNDGPPTVGFSSATYTVNEGAGTATIAVNLSARSGRTVTVNYATSDGTATAGSDYTTGSGILTFSPGQTSRTLNVAITDDTMDEDNETVNLTLSNAVNATIGGTNPVTLTILDNEGSYYIYLPLAVRNHPQTP